MYRYVINYDGSCTSKKVRKYFRVLSAKKNHKSKFEDTHAVGDLGY